MALTLDQQMTLILVFIGVITFILTIIKLFTPSAFDSLKGGRRKKKRREKRVPEVIEKEVKIKAGEYYLQPLGELSKGDTLKGKCFETLGENFSYYVLNEMGKIAYEKSAEIKKPVCAKRNKAKTTINCEIKFKDTYYILFTHQATVNPRKVKYRVEIDRR